MFNFPVLRIGQVVKAENNFTSEKAKIVADNIIQRENEFMQVAYDCYKSNHATKTQVVDRKAQLVKEETIVINFKAHEVYFSNYICQCRVSLTVCCEEKRSKIWARMSLKKTRDANADNFSYDENNQYYKYVEKIANCLVKSTKSQYKKVLKDLNYAYHLEERYRFKIYGINTHNQDLNKLFNEVERSNITSLEEALSYEPYRKSLKPLFSSNINSPKKMISYARSKDSFLNYFEDTNRKKSENFKSFSLTKTSEDEAMVKCLCYNEPKPNVKHSQADLATADILKRYASVL